MSASESPSETLKQVSTVKERTWGRRRGDYYTGTPWRYCGFGSRPPQ